MIQKNNAIYFTMLILFFSFISLAYAEETQITKENFISQFMGESISSPLLKIIGINETITMEELIVTLILIIIAYAIIFGFADFTEMLGKGTTAIIALILVLIGSQFGFVLKIAREILKTKDIIQFLISYKITIAIMLGVLVIIAIIAKLLKKEIPNLKQLKEKEKTERRKAKVEKLAKIKDMELDNELRINGIDPD